MGMLQYSLIVDSHEVDKHTLCGPLEVSPVNRGVVGSVRCHNQGSSS